MNLNELQEAKSEATEDSKEEVAESKPTTEESSATQQPTEQKKPTKLDATYALEELETLGVESNYWDKEFPLKDATIVALYPGYSFNFETKEQNFNKDGSPALKMLIEFETIGGNKVFTECGFNSRLKDCLSKALRIFNPDAVKFKEILGMKVNLECLNAKAVQLKKAKAYEFEAEVLGKGTAKVKGIFSLDTGEQIKE